jgi:hypothetical protein
MAAVALVLAGLASESASVDRNPAPGAQPDLGKQVAALEKKVQQQEEKITALEDQMRAIDSWFQGLPMAAQRLDNGLARVRSEGFTKAGANLNSRETLLETVNALGQGLTRELPALGTKKKDERR